MSVSWKGKKLYRSRIRIAVETPTIPKTDEAFISILRETTTLWIKEFDIDKNSIVDGQMAFNTGVEITDEYKNKPFRVIVEEYELVANDPVRESAFAPGVESKSVTMGERLVFLDVFEVGGVRERFLPRRVSNFEHEVIELS